MLVWPPRTETGIAGPAPAAVEMSHLDRPGKSVDDIDERALQSLYAVMGGTQSLLEAMKKPGDNMKQVNRNQQAVARL